VKNESIYEVAQKSGKEFENWVARIFHKFGLGEQTMTYGNAGDGGIDIIGSDSEYAVYGAENSNSYMKNVVLKFKSDVNKFISKRDIRKKFVFISNTPDEKYPYKLIDEKNKYAHLMIELWSIQDIFDKVLNRNIKKILPIDLLKQLRRHYENNFQTLKVTSWHALEQPAMDNLKIFSHFLEIYSKYDTVDNLNKQLVAIFDLYEQYAFYDPITGLYLSKRTNKNEISMETQMGIEKIHSLVKNFLKCLEELV
jgi:hypothetical protein